MLLRTLLVFLVFCNSVARAQRLAEHVFIVSFDGGKPAVIAESEVPNLKKLAQEGAVTWEAQTIFPPKTLPSHTSMFTGLSPSKHGVLWNSYLPARGTVLAPTVFSIARQHDSTFGTALFAGKMKFRHLWQKGTLDVFDLGGRLSEEPAQGTDEVEKATVPSEKVAADAAEYIVRAKPNLCGIHFPDPDSAGHAYGWGSTQQREAFKATDKALGLVLDAIKRAGIADSSVVLISADHGGHAKTHGDNTPEDMTIPWLAWGTRVKKQFQITSPVTTFDTAATALWLLGVPCPPELDGKPVKEAFDLQL